LSVLLQHVSIANYTSAVLAIVLLIPAGQDTLQSWHAQLTERFFRRSVLCEASCLHYLLPEEQDSSVTDRLRHAKTLEHIPGRTNKFQNCFIHIACDIMISLGPILHWLCWSNPATGCYTK